MMPSALTECTPCWFDVCYRLKMMGIKPLPSSDQKIGCACRRWKTYDSKWEALATASETCSSIRHIMSHSVKCLCLTESAVNTMGSKTIYYSPTAAISLYVLQQNTQQCRLRALEQDNVCQVNSKCNIC
jgi:hypothetical protein